MVVPLLMLLQRLSKACLVVLSLLRHWLQNTSRFSSGAARDAEVMGGMGWSLKDWSFNRSNAVVTAGLENSLSILVFA